MNLIDIIIVSMSVFSAFYVGGIADMKGDPLWMRLCVSTIIIVLTLVFLNI
jgi:hypothetical protein